MSDLRATLSEIKLRDEYQVAFLLPFVPWLLITLFGAGAIAVLHEALKGGSGKTFAILGESRSGKTMLSRFLSQGIISDPTYKETPVYDDFKGRKLRLEDGTTFHIGNLKDLPGEESAWKTWKERVQDSDYVIYLLRSHLLRTGRGTARDRSRRDLQQLSLWLKEMKAEGSSRPRVILTFSFRDLDADHEQSVSDLSNTKKQLCECVTEACACAGVFWPSLEPQAGSGR